MKHRVAQSGHDTNFLLGVQAGYDWQDRYFVYGVAADWTWTNMKSSTIGNSGSLSWENKVNWLASFRGRAGLALDTNLLYVTGGVALADIRNNTAIGCACSLVTSLKRVSVGLPAWALNISSTHIGLSPLNTFTMTWEIGRRPSHTAATPTRISSAKTINVGRLGMNYRF